MTLNNANLVPSGDNEEYLTASEVGIDPEVATMVPFESSRVMISVEVRFVSADKDFRDVVNWI